MYACLLMPPEMSLVSRPSSSSPTPEDSHYHPYPHNTTDNQHGLALSPRQKDHISHYHGHHQHQLGRDEMTFTLKSNVALTPGTVFYPDEGEMRLERIADQCPLAADDIRRVFGCYDIMLKIDGQEVRHCNWVRFIRVSEDAENANIICSLGRGQQPYYQVVKPVRSNHDLVVFFNAASSATSERHRSSLYQSHPGASLLSSSAFSPFHQPMFYPNTAAYFQNSGRSNSCSGMPSPIVPAMLLRHFNNNNNNKKMTSTPISVKTGEIKHKKDVIHDFTDTKDNNNDLNLAHDLSITSPGNESGTSSQHAAYNTSQHYYHYRTRSTNDNNNDDSPPGGLSSSSVSLSPSFSSPLLQPRHHQHHQHQCGEGLDYSQPRAATGTHHNHNQSCLSSPWMTSSSMSHDSEDGSTAARDGDSFSRRSGYGGDCGSDADENDDRVAMLQKDVSCVNDEENDKYFQMPPVRSKDDEWEKKQMNKTKPEEVWVKMEVIENDTNGDGTKDDHCSRLKQQVTTASGEVNDDTDLTVDVDSTGMELSVDEEEIETQSKRIAEQQPHYQERRHKNDVSRCTAVDSADDIQETETSKLLYSEQEPRPTQGTCAPGPKGHGDTDATSGSGHCLSTTNRPRPQSEQPSWTSGPATHHGKTTGLATGNNHVTSEHQITSSTQATLSLSSAGIKEESDAAFTATDQSEGVVDMSTSRLRLDQSQFPTDLQLSERLVESATRHLGTGNRIKAEARGNLAGRVGVSSSSTTTNTPTTTTTTTTNSTSTNPSSTREGKPVKRCRERSWWPCEMCGKKFDRPSLLKRHVRTHTGEKPHACDVCGKAFSTSSSLNTHRRIHSGEKPHQCKVCGKRFTASSNLYYHRMTHNKEKPHKCTLCSKSFPTPGDLRSHQYIHSGSWPFRCHLCNRGFSKQTNLRNHMMLHSGDKPHECHRCGKKFALLCNLKTHCKTHDSSDSSECLDVDKSEEQVDVTDACTENLPNNFKRMDDITRDDVEVPFDRKNNVLKRNFQAKHQTTVSEMSKPRSYGNTAKRHTTDFSISKLTSSDKPRSKVHEDFPSREFSPALCPQNLPDSKQYPLIDPAPSPPTAVSVSNYPMYRHLLAAASSQQQHHYRLEHHQQQQQQEQQQQQQQQLLLQQHHRWLLAQGTFNKYLPSALANPASGLVQPIQTTNYKDLQNPASPLPFINMAADNDGLSSFGPKTHPKLPTVLLNNSLVPIPAYVTPDMAIGALQGSRAAPFVPGLPSIHPLQAFWSNQVMANGI